MELNEKNKELLKQVFVGALIAGIIYSVARSQDKKKLLDKSTLLPVLPAIVNDNGSNKSDVVNPIQNTENVTPVDNYNIVKDNKVMPVPEPVVLNNDNNSNSVATPVPAPAMPIPAPSPQPPVVLTEQQKMTQKLLSSTMQNGLTNLDKAKIFLSGKGIDINALPDKSSEGISKEDGIIHAAFENGCNPVA